MKFSENRIDFLLPYVKKKSVLELGCVGMGINDTMGGRDFVHGKIKPITKNLLGLDKNEEGIKLLKKHGFNVKYQDISKPFNLKQKFDVILAEEVLEHIENLETTFSNIREHLIKEGLLIITTPNPQAIAFFFQRLLKNKIWNVSVHDHVHWFCKDTLKTLLERHNFIIIKDGYIYPKPLEKIFIWNITKRLFWTPFPQQVGKSLFVIAKKIE